MPRKTLGGDVVRAHRGRASMRPRPDAAENVNVGRREYAVRPASMRPRPDAAENARQSASAPRPGGGFNEAAARCRGKPVVTMQEARMTALGFNEAAARCRGKLIRSRTMALPHVWLQ